MQLVDESTVCSLPVSCSELVLGSMSEAQELVIYPPLHRKHYYKKETEININIDFAMANRKVYRQCAWKEA